MQDRADPHARECAFIIARPDPPPRQHCWPGSRFPRMSSLTNPPSETAAPTCTKFTSPT